MRTGGGCRCFRWAGVRAGGGSRDVAGSCGSADLTPLKWWHVVRVVWVQWEVGGVVGAISDHRV